MNEPTLFDIPSAPLDAERAAILDLIAGDPLHAGDRAKIVTAILKVGRADGGRVDPNAVRALLTYEGTCELTVLPQLVGPTYRLLCNRGVLVRDNYVLNLDRHGGNYGKHARSYRLIRSAVAA